MFRIVVDFPKRCGLGCGCAQEAQQTLIHHLLKRGFASDPGLQRCQCFIFTSNGRPFHSLRAIRSAAQKLTLIQDEGILTVEMEASALFAVAHVHKIDLGALFTIADLHTDQDWMPSFENEKSKEGKQTLLKVALAAATEKQ